MGSSKAPQQLRELLAAMLLAGAAAPGASPGPRPRAATVTPDCALRHYQSEAQLKLGHDLASCIARSQSSAGSLPRHLPRAQPGSGGGRAQWTRCLAGTPYAQLRVQTCLVRPSSDPFFGPASVGGQPRLRALAAALSLCRATAPPPPPPPPSPAVVAAAPAARRRHSTVVERPRASGSGGLLSHLRIPFLATLARGAAPPRGPPAPGVRGWTRASGGGTSGGGGDALPGVHAAGAAAAVPAAAGGTAQLNPSAVHSLQRRPASGAAVVDAPPPPHPPPPPPPIGTAINVNALRSALLHGRRFSLPERWQQQQQQQQLAPAGAVHMCASPLATSARPTAPSMQAHAQYPPAPTGASTVAVTLGGAGAAGSVLSAAGACRTGLVPQPPAPRHPGARRPV